MATTTMVPGAAQPRRWALALLLGTALLAALAFIVIAALPYFLSSASRLGEYGTRGGVLLTHIAAGIAAIVVGPFQLWMGLTGRRAPFHRTLGKIYMGAIAVSAAAGYYLAFNTDGGWVFGAGLAGLATAWVITTGMAYAAIRRRLFDQHKEWMIRSYVVTFGFVFFRMFFAATEAAGVGTVFERLGAASWFCWAVPLLVCEAVLQGRKVFGAPAEA